MLYVLFLNDNLDTSHRIMMQNQNEHFPYDHWQCVSIPYLTCLLFLCKQICTHYPQHHLQPTSTFPHLLISVFSFLSPPFSPLHPHVSFHLCTSTAPFHIICRPLFSSCDFYFFIFLMSFLFLCTLFSLLPIHPSPPVSRGRWGGRRGQRAWRDPPWQKERETARQEHFQSCSW